MRILLSDGRVFSGTPLQIVRAMQDVAFGAEHFSTAEYIDWVATNAERAEGVALQIEGETDEERAASLLAEMLRVGLATKPGTQRGGPSQR